MPRARKESVEEHLPSGELKGCLLVVSDHRSLNVGHAYCLCSAGYAVYTAVTCTDVPRVLERFCVGPIDAIVFASKVHGWHHREAERRPESIPQESDDEWQTRNLKEVIAIVCARQANRPTVIIAEELLTPGWYDTTQEALAAAGIEYQTYSAGDPHGILACLR
ncbi:MAG: hypothetical protein ABFE16_14435 [Armatimonadia bacterium]